MEVTNLLYRKRKSIEELTTATTAGNQGGHRRKRSKRNNYRCSNSHKTDTNQQRQQFQSKPTPLLNIVQLTLGKNNVHSLLDFLNQHLSPFLYDLSPLYKHRINWQLDHVFVYVYKPPFPSKHWHEEEPQYSSINSNHAAASSTKLPLQAPVFHESLKSVIQHALQTLVLQEEQRPKRSWYRSKSNSSSINNNASRNPPKNLLTYGDNRYNQRNQDSRQKTKAGNNTTDADTGATTVAAMKATSFNANVNYLYTSDLIKVLHQCVGDNVLRAILLHTSIFIPIKGIDNGNDSNISNDITLTNIQSTTNNKNVRCSQLNFWQICGPPLRGGTLPREGSSNTKVTSKSSHRPNRKRKRNTNNNKSDEDVNSSNNKNFKKLDHKKVESKQAGSALKHHLRPCTIVNRRAIFYNSSYTPKVQLPTFHVLIQNKPEVLLQAWFDENPSRVAVAFSQKTTIVDNSNSGNNGNLVIINKNSNNKFIKTFKRSLWNRAGKAGLEVAQRVLQQHNKCDYSRLLDHYCPLPDFCSPFNRGNKRRPKKDTLLTLAQLSQAYTPTNQVASFLVSVVSKIFPEAMWGIASNKDQVLKTARLFVTLNRHDNLCNKDLTNNIKIKPIGWLRGNKTGKMTTSDLETSKMLWLKVMRWLLQDFCAPLLQVAFYATETEFSGTRVCYYRKPVWSIFRAISVQSLTKTPNILTQQVYQPPQFTEISASQVVTRLQQQQQQQATGFSRLRLVPKSTGVRPIALLGKSERVAVKLKDSYKALECNGGYSRTNHWQLVNNRLNADTNALQTQMIKVFLPRLATPNSVLKDAFAVLSKAYLQEPDLFGAGVHGLHYFYPRYRNFISKLKPSLNDVKIYFASVDIKKCYDNINQEHLLDIVTNLLKKDDYLLQRYNVLHFLRSQHRTFCRPMCQAVSTDNFCSFQQLLSLPENDYKCSVFQDTSRYNIVKKDYLLDQVRDHLQNNVVVVRGRHQDRFLKQSKGIPQGSVLSSLLCNFYYGNVEKDLLAHLGCVNSDDDNCDNSDITNSSMLVRMVDDFMLVTSSLPILKDFLQTMSVGNAALGAQINTEKTRTSVNVTVDFDNKKTNIKAVSTKRFSWCGMLFDTHTREVMVDYSRLLNEDNGDSIAGTIGRNYHQGWRLQMQMHMFVRPRCLAIYFDPLINSDRTQIINFYQLMLLASTKTVLYLSSLSSTTNDILSNLSFLIDCMKLTTQYAYSLIRARLKNVGVCNWNKIPHSVANWLGWKAFITTLSISGRFKPLLTTLVSKEPFVDAKLLPSKALLRKSVKDMHLENLFKDK